MTLLEIVIALAILSVVITASLLAMVRNAQLQESNREFLAAATSSQRVLAMLEGSGDFVDIFRRFNAVSGDDHADGNNPGNLFAVAKMVRASEVYDTEGKVVGFTRNQLISKGLDLSNYNLAAAQPSSGLGEIFFPVDPTNGAILRENLNSPDWNRLGLPMDLDGSGVTPDGGDHALDYMILPVWIRVRWTGYDGQPQEFNLRTLLTLQ